MHVSVSISVDTLIYARDVAGVPTHRTLVAMAFKKEGAFIHNFDELHYDYTTDPNAIIISGGPNAIKPHPWKWVRDAAKKMRLFVTNHAARNPV